MSKSFPWWAVVAMAVVVGASNYLVTIPINDWLVWGAITYPFAFLVNDLVNRFYGVEYARKVVYVGFAVAIAAGLTMSFFVEDMGPRIIIASGLAFLVAQMLDVSIFDRLRVGSWWIAPSVSSAISTVVDTVLFFGIAFAGTGLPWMQWATGDLGVKWAVAVGALFVYRLLSKHFARNIDGPQMA